MDPRNLMQAHPGLTALVAVALTLALLIATPLGGLLVPSDEGAAEPSQVIAPTGTADNQAREPGPGTDQERERGEITFEVDPSTAPERDRLPPREPGGRDRPVERLEEDGTGADFVGDEVIVSGDLALETVLDRYPGEVLGTYDPDEHNSTGPATYLVRVNVSGIDPRDVRGHVLEEAPEATGDISVSSRPGLQLLTAVAKARADGLDVGANFVLEPDTLLDGQTAEAPRSSGGNLDAFDWDHLNGDSPADHNVTAAWQALERIGELDSTVPIAILDNGFSDHRDLQDPYLANGGVGDPNDDYDCDAPGCFWHGTAAANAAFAVPDNGYGVAGPAGPVAKPILLTFHGDFYGLGSWIRFATDELGARVVSISYSGELASASEHFRGDGIDDAVQHARAMGTTVVASAGNDGKNVDKERVFREKRDILPCEYQSVVCVGGLQDGRFALYRDPGSNYGSKLDSDNTVDIYAPYCMPTGGWPTRDASGAWQTGSIPNVPNWGVCGTSFSAPYVAGVIGLMLAADPALSVEEIQSILYETAHPSPDDEVHRVVNALGAVRGALGYNLAPTLEIVRPADGGTYPLGAISHLMAHADDHEDAHAQTPRSGMLPQPWFEGQRREAFEGSVTWTLDGERLPEQGQRVPIDADRLDVGYHVLEAEVTDAGGKRATDRVSFEVINRAPQVEITSPSDGARFPQGAELDLRAWSWDPDRTRWLDDDQVSWRSSIDGPLGQAHNRTARDLSLGTHTITFRAEDAEGGETTDTVQITVVEACPGASSGAVIGTPADGTVFQADRFEEETFLEGRDAYARAVDLAGWACREDGTRADPTNVRWKVRFVEDGNTYTRDLGTASELTHDLYAYETCRGLTSYEVFFQVFFDGSWHVASHEVEVQAPIC